MGTSSLYDPAYNHVEIFQLSTYKNETVVLFENAPERHGGQSRGYIN